MKRFLELHFGKMFDSRGKIAMFIIMLIASCLSFTFTLDMLITEATSTRERIIIFGVVIILECGKYYFVHKLLLALGNFWVNLFFAVTLTVISLLCSSAYLINKSNENEQNIRIESPRYKAISKSIESKDEIRKEFIKWDRITKANAVQDQIDKLKIERSNIDVSAIAYTGRTALFLAISKLFKIKVMWVIIAFNLTISLMTELLAIAFANEYLKNFRKREEMDNVIKRIKKPIELENKPSIKPIQTIANKEEIKKDDNKDFEIKKISDIDFTDKPFTKDEFASYYKMMNKTQDNGFSKGYKKICDFIKSEGGKLTQVKGNDIRRYLEKIKVIELEGNRTKIVRKVKV